MGVGSGMIIPVAESTELVIFGERACAVSTSFGVKSVVTIENNAKLPSCSWTLIRFLIKFF